VPIDRDFLYVKIPLLLRGCHNSYEQSLGQDVLFQYYLLQYLIT